MIKILTKVASASFISAVLVFVYQAYLTHALNVSDNGIFSEWLTSISYVELLFIMGLDSALIYFTKLGENIEENILRNITIYTLVMVFLIGILFVSKLSVIYYGSLITTVYFMAIISSFKAFFQLKEDFKMYNILTIQRPMLILMLFVIYSFFITNKINWKEAVVIFSISFCVNFLVSLCYIFNKIPIVKIKIFRLSYFKYGWKGIFNKILSLLLYALDIYLISYFLDKSSVAYYFIAVAISKLSWLITDASGNILYPKFIKIKSEKDRIDAIDHMFLMGSINFVVNILAFVIFYLIGEKVILLIYEDSYLNSFIPALILLLGSQAMAYYKLLGRFFASQNNWKPLYYSLITGISINLVLNILLLKFTSLGITGVALASIIAYWGCGIVISMFLKGTPKSKFSVAILRQGKIIKKEITREKVIVNPVPFSKMIDSETGYIVLTRFNNKASSEVKKAFKKLKKEGMTKLVFDLRFNPGGSLLESINISNFFLPKGKKIVSTKAKIKKWSNTYRTTNKPLDLEIPIVVLINGRSASASEIVSGSLQDYDRAVIMGQRSFGKGLVQRYRELTYGTQLKVTISKYYTPSGRCIQELDYANRDKNGVVPKFSDKGINQFKTAKGRIVYDGGGVLPDVISAETKRTKATKTLLKSKAIFNYATKYFYENSNVLKESKFEFNDSNFKDFVKYLKVDTSFVTKQEALFKEAYKMAPSKNIAKDYKEIQTQLYKNKIQEITKNKDILKNVLKDEILKRYVYKEGVYNFSLKNDLVINEAVKLLNNPEKYKQILSVK